MMAKTFLGLGLALLVPAALLAATLTVTPSSVSNGYSGDLVVSITGLTNLEPIFLDKYLDANGDGTVNAGEPLLQRFRITEGSASTIGGATNLNRPGDTDGLANGQISARLNFAAASEFNRVAGQYRFRLSSPSGRFCSCSPPIGARRMRGSNHSFSVHSRTVPSCAPPWTLNE